MTARLTNPKNYLASAGTALCDGSGVLGSDWVKSETNTGAVSDSTVDNLYAGNKTIRLQTQAVAGSNCFITQAVNLSMASAVSVSLTMYVGEVLAGTGATVTVYFITSTPGVTAYYSLGFTGAKPGWNTITRPISAFAVTGSPAWSTIRQIRIRADSSANISRDFYFGALAYNVRNATKVVLSFDDGYDDALAVDTIATAANIPVSYGIIPSLIDAANYLTTAQLTTLAASSYAEICCHDEDQWASVTYANGGESLLLSNLNVIRNYIRNYDTVGCNYAILPAGDYGQSSYRLWNRFMPSFRKAGFAAARMIVPTTAEIPFLMNEYVGVGDELLVPSFLALNSTNTLAAVLSALATGVTYTGNIFIYGHKLDVAADSLTWVTSEFQTLVDTLVRYRSLGLLEVVTFSEWHLGLRSPRPAVTRATY